MLLGGEPSKGVSVIEGGGGGRFIEDWASFVGVGGGGRVCIDGIDAWIYGDC